MTPASVLAGTVQLSATLVAPATNVPQALSEVSNVPLTSKSIQPQTWPDLEAPDIGTVRLYAEPMSEVLITGRP